jgi:hypothetical protein
MQTSPASDAERSRGAVRGIRWFGGTFRVPLPGDSQDEKMSMADLVPGNGNLCKNISISGDARRRLSNPRRREK